MKIFYKKRFPSGRRDIYFCGIKIYSYNHKINQYKLVNYKTYNDLATDVKNNMHKIPTDIDLVVGVPRSGMIPAYIIGLALNKKVCSINEFLNGFYGDNGITRPINSSTMRVKRVLVVDDTVNTGTSINTVKRKLTQNYDDIDFFFLAVYSTDKKSDSFVDLSLAHLNQPRIFQWNYLYHNIIKYSCYDMDGVLCADPSDEENDDGEKYVHFIQNAKPLYVPNFNIGCIITSRLEKYRALTEKWLKDNNIKYDKLYMLDATAEQRRRNNLHAKFKAKIYKNLKDYVLFIESEPHQAAEIAKLSGKPCICCKNDKLYGG